MVSRNSNNNTQSSVPSNSNNITPKNNEFAENFAHAAKPESGKAASPQSTKNQGRKNTSLLFDSTAAQKPFKHRRRACNSHHLQLHAACLDGNTDAVQALLGNSADVNMKDDDGDTPLLIACRNGHMGVVKALLNNEADVNMKDDDRDTPLLIASRNGHMGIVKALLGKGAYVNMKDEDGDAPLLIACRNGHTDAVQALLGNGADVNMKDDDGDTPLHIACLGRVIRVWFKHSSAMAPMLT